MRNWRHFTIPLAVFLAVAGAAGVWFQSAESLEQATIRSRGTLTAKQVALRLESYIEVRLNLMTRMQGAWARGAIVTPEAFRDYAADLQRHFGGITSINWVDADGVIRWLVPEQPNLAARDQDLTQKPLAGPVLAEARRSGALRITPPLDLYQGGRGFAAYLPLRRNGQAEGFLNVAFRSAPLVEDCLAHGVRDHFFLSIHDGDSEVYDYGAAQHEPAQLQFVATQNFAVGDRTWQLTLTPKLLESDRAFLRSNELALAANLLVALVLGLVSWWWTTSRTALRASEERYRRIVEDMPNLICRFRPDTTITFVNEEYARCFGVPREALVGTSMLTTISATQHDAIRGHIASLTRERPVRTIDRHVVTATGGLRWQRWSDRAMFGPDGTVIELQSIGTDITEQKGAEQALRDGEDRFRTIFNSSQEAIYIFDHRGAVVRVNQRALEWHGLTGDEAQQASFSSLTAVSPAVALEQFRAVVDHGQARSFEWQAVHRDGSQRCTEIKLSPLRIDGAERILAVARDLTRRKQLELQLQQATKMEAVGTLAAGVAHDFNNILTAILGHAHFARLTVAGDSRTAEALDGIAAACAQATVVTRSLLTFSRHDSTERLPLRLDKLIAETVRMLKPILPAAVEVGVETPPLTAWVMGGETQLQQVLMNLAVNARDAMPDGGRLNFACTLIPGNRVELTVSDTGVGMNEEVRLRVFDPFFTTKPRERGTGLGMSVAHGIVTAHAGEMRVESEKGKGTRVTVTLALCQPPVAAEQGEKPQRLPWVTNTTVLVVEDNDPVRHLAVTMLEASGFRTLEARDGVEATRNFDDQRPPDLLILDIDLPRLSGLQVLHQLRRSHPDIPAILISGLPTPGLEQMHAVSFLQKPFSMAELVRLAARSVATTAAIPPATGADR